MNITFAGAKFTERGERDVDAPSQIYGITNGYACSTTICLPNIYEVEGKEKNFKFLRFLRLKSLNAERNS